MADADESTKTTSIQPEGTASERPGGLDSGERLVVIGGALLFVVSFVIFELILEEYLNWQLGWLAAVGALVAVWLRSRDREAVWPVAYATVLLVLGWIAVATGAHGLILDLRNGLSGGATIVGALSSHAGAALLLLGCPDT